MVKECLVYDIYKICKLNMDWIVGKNILFVFLIFLVFRSRKWKEKKFVKWKIEGGNRKKVCF